MTSPLPLPDWMPWWVHFAVLLAGLFLFVMFLFMPFSVFGVKSRLEAIDARLDEIQGEIRSLSLRLPEPGLVDSEDDYRAAPRPGLRPPIPPAPVIKPRPGPPRGARTEPRLY